MPRTPGERSPVMGYKVAVVGATGAVGNEMLQILAERQFPVDEIVALASERSTGKEVRSATTARSRCRTSTASTSRASTSGCSRPAPRSRPSTRRKRRGQGLRGDRQHLAVPHGPRRAAGRAGGEPRGARDFRTRNIIANPNCSTIQMVVALKPLHDIARIKRVVVATYQSVSGRRQGGDGRALRAHQGAST